MELIKPSLAYFDTYLAALKEFEMENISGFWKYFGSTEHPEIYLQTISCYEHKAGVEQGVVPASVFWLVEKGVFVGHVSIRHKLNDGLKVRGGHIGYVIRPSQHRKGYGSEILRLALPQAKILGITSALLTCEKTNVASSRIIEKNGGRLIKEFEIDGKLVQHFIIDL